MGIAEEIERRVLKEICTLKTYILAKFSSKDKETP